MHWIAHLEGGPKRVNHAAVAVGHKIYTFGGYCTGENSRAYTSMDVHVLNTSTLRWTKHPVSDLPYYENDDILPYKRYGHTAVIYQDKIYIWGGRNDRASCSVLFCFDTTWHCWTAPKTTGDIPPARDGHSACVWKHHMIIYGGFEEESDSFARYVYALDLHKMCWSYIYTSGPEPAVRDFHTSVCINNKMYLFGGRGTNSRNDIYLPGEETYSNELWYLDLQTFQWHQVEVNGDIPVGRRSHSAFAYNNKMYIFGGYNALKEQHYNDFYAFDCDTCTWKLLKAIGENPCNRRRQACVVVNDRMYLFGGTSPILSNTVDEFRHDSSSDDILVDHGDLHVLDFKPSLKILCIIMVRKYKLDERILPANVRNDIKNMYMPNKIINRLNNSAG